ncbi:MULTISPECIES: AIPR family protein [Bacillus]|uniref:AIPR family protein n=1 Tax=Bacillus TaxID=1386 RepID=UPI0022E3C43F|nr:MULTISPECIES: AIPR family protein [Bacillus]MDA1881005.1 AIPR family protein [Bacillus cereus group sp. BY10-2LC]MDV5068335.1 AIPR family protein [Bacillus sp. W1]
MNLFQQMEKIIRFQVNEEGLDESTVDFQNEVMNKIIDDQYTFENGISNKPKVLILSNKDLSLDYQENEFEHNNEIDRPILFIFCYTSQGFNTENISAVLKQIKEIIETDKLTNSNYNPTVKLFFISKNLQTTICSNTFLTDQDIRSTVLEYMKAKIKKYFKRDITVTCDYLESEERIQDSPIRVLSRTRATQSRHLKTPKTEGYVFSANLYDLVTLYNKKGKTLFAKNIRYGIADELDVDSAINETLTKNPEAFWYLNNGITLILEKNNLNLQDYEKICLSDPKLDSNQIKLTVINGAQTLNSAAKFFYTQKDTNDSKHKAFVMLKVIEITTNKNETEHVNNRIDEITISLNRQKPIITDDIAFTLPVVKHINNLREKIDLISLQKNSNSHNIKDKYTSEETMQSEQLNNTLDTEASFIPKEKDKLQLNDKQEEDLSPYVFSIVRRGDVSSTRNKRYTLKVLPRILYTILLEKPGTARTGSNKSLIAIDPNNNHFKKDDLFPTIQRDEQQFEDIFITNYKPVNFAMALYDTIDVYVKDEGVINFIAQTYKEGEHINKYGKYLLIYSIVKTLKGTESNFKKWLYTDKHVQEFLDAETYKELVKELTNAWKNTVTDGSKWDSNAFKKDTNLTATYNYCKDKIKAILNKNMVIETEVDKVLVTSSSLK